jgi:protein gp37
LGAETRIAWCDSTFNTWWGCTRCDPACLHCYAEILDKRTGGAHWGPKAARRFFGDKHWNEPRKWDRAAAKDGVRRRVFCASMADWCDALAPRDARLRLFALIRDTPNLDWLLLTKRAEQIRGCLPADWGKGYDNVWLGVTVADMAGRWRLDYLGQIPAPVHFVSCEPLLEDLDLRPWLGVRGAGAVPAEVAREAVDWIIVGGESGAGARAMDEDWVRSLRDQAVESGAGFFYKQRVEGNGLRKIETPVLDGRRWTDGPRRVVQPSEKLVRIEAQGSLFADDG